MAEKELLRRHLEVLVMVEREGSVHAAAQALSMTQPAVSRLVAESERLLGAQLFERSSRGSTPTAQGRAVLARARALLRGFERLRDFAGGGQPVIRIGCIPRVMHGLMPRVLERVYAAGASTYRLQLIEDNSAALIEKVARGELDFSISRLADARLTERMVSEHLYSERTVVVCAAGNRAVPRTAMSLAALLEYPWVLPHRETSSRATLDRVLREQALPGIVPIIEARSFETNLAVIAGTRLLSIAPESIARQQAALGALRIVTLKQPLPVSAVMLCHQRDAVEDPTLEGFRRLLLDAARETRAAIRARRAPK
ncbi:MAG TPA: LysR substrate-binding domain-containing protein [Burkholderiales bacterium]|jgi:DNA-binding transcriptional LysR family regulator|nr:LysR substrate-binding domain-containing protein [Burkholderiales bacterium]